MEYPFLPNEPILKTLEKRITAWSKAGFRATKPLPTPPIIIPFRKSRRPTGKNKSATVFVVSKRLKPLQSGEGNPYS
jgi:hypothetical protein